MRLPRVEDFPSQGRGPRTTARAGTWLGLAFLVCFLTGLWSHVQQTTPEWLTLPVDPSWLYRVTQGVHVSAGTAAVPLLLVKLWSVYPRLFRRPPYGLGPVLRHLAERLSVLVLVAAAIFQLASGLTNLTQWYPWAFSFRATHYAVAWIAIGALGVHLAVKWPVIREAYARERAPVAAADAHTRRSVLRAAGIASGLAVLLTAGQTVPWLRRISILAVRSGDGPQGLPVNRTAAQAGVTRPVDWRLEVRRGDLRRTFTRAELEAMPQATHRLPIACVEGWSRSAEWTGVPVRVLLATVGAPPQSSVTVTSLQTRRAFATADLPPAFAADPRTLLALRLNGEDLDLDHGWPCRLIAPNRPGVRQTKWVTRLEVAR